MDFIDWCRDIISIMIEYGGNHPESRTYGMDEWNIAEMVYGNALVVAPSFRGSSHHKAIIHSLQALSSVDLIEKKGHSRWRVLQDGRRFKQNPIPLWEKICTIPLESEQVMLLTCINNLSPLISDDHVILNEIKQDVVIAAGGAPDFDTLLAITNELEELGLVRVHRLVGPYLGLYATYKGLIWETRRAFTQESRFIDDLIAEWETTSVDFKRQLSVDTDDEKAEFTKDILGLVNTQASGRRWLIIGFHPKTREYYGPPDERITQDRLEQIIKNCIQPFVTIKYSVVAYRDGRVAKLEVIREPTKLPYTVAKNLGSHKKRLQQGQMFVRHGSQTEEPTPAEQNAIEAEGRRARGERNDA